MRRHIAVLGLVLTLVSVPALGQPSLPANEGSPWSWWVTLSGFVDQVITWVTGADEVVPDGDNEVRGWLDPNGIAATEPEPPAGEIGGGIDPDG